MQEIIEALHLTVSNETVRKTVRQLGYRRKKKSLHAGEQERLRCGAEEKKTGTALYLDSKQVILCFWMKADAIRI